MYGIADQPTNDNNDNDDLNNSNDNGDGDTTQHQGDAQPKPPPVKKKRTKKAVSTVTKNKDTLNARLEISQMPDALIFKLNSILSESSKGDKMLLTILETKVSDVKLTSNPFWENDEIEPFDMVDDVYDGPFTALPLTINSDPNLSLRQQLSSFKLLETPISDEDEYVFFLFFII